MTQEQVRVIVFEDDGVYVAQCLEYDICAFAGDMETLRRRFAGLFAFEHNLSIERNGAPFAGIDQAPQNFHDMWNDHTDPDTFTIAKAPVVMARAAA